MDRDFEFFKTSMPASRPADYYLGCLGGSVFLDFDRRDGRICMVRISFDGYGCCNLGKSAIGMNESDSRSFTAILSSGQLDQETMAEIVKRSIHENLHLLWTDALQEYRLI